VNTATCVRNGIRIMLIKNAPAEQSTGAQSDPSSSRDQHQLCSVLRPTNSLEGRPSNWEADRLLPAICGIPVTSEWPPGGGPGSLPERHSFGGSRSTKIGDDRMYCQAGVVDVLSTMSHWRSPQSAPHSGPCMRTPLAARSRRSSRYFIAGSATLELLSALRYPRLTQALYIVAHGLGDIRKVLLYRRLDGESRL
jgi:hypothetical protein